MKKKLSDVHVKMEVSFSGWNTENVWTKSVCVCESKSCVMAMLNIKHKSFGVIIVYYLPHGQFKYQTMTETIFALMISNLSFHSIYD